MSISSTYTREGQGLCVCGLVSCLGNGSERAQWAAMVIGHHSTDTLIMRLTLKHQWHGNKMQPHEPNTGDGANLLMKMFASVEKNLSSPGVQRKRIFVSSACLTSPSAH